MRPSLACIYRGLAVFLSLAFIHGCGSWLQPEIETNTAELREGHYRVDPRHTTVLFKVNHLGLSKFVGRFNAFEATLDYDPENPADAVLDAIVHTASVDVADNDFEETLRGDSWLNTEQFPQAHFKTRTVEMFNDNRARFTGDFTFLGVTAPITLDVEFNGGAFNMLTGRYTLGFSATGKIQRSAFGMGRFIPAIGDTVELEVHAEFLRD